MPNHSLLIILVLILTMRSHPCFSARGGCHAQLCLNSALKTHNIAKQKKYRFFSCAVLCHSLTQTKYKYKIPLHAPKSQLTKLGDDGWQKPLRRNHHFVPPVNIKCHPLPCWPSGEFYIRSVFESFSSVSFSLIFFDIEIVELIPTKAYLEVVSLSFELGWGVNLVCHYTGDSLQ